MPLSPQTEIAFFGRITAGVTHELKNVLAIINESSGLMQDLMTLSKEMPAYHDRFQKALSSIKNQIQRGQSLIARLNQFAHAPDTRVRTVDISEAAVHLAALSQRFAALKKVSLKIAPSPLPERPVVATLNLVHLQMALFAAIDCWLALATPGSEISIHISAAEDAGIVQVLWDGPFAAGSHLADDLAAAEKWPLLQAAADSLGGRVQIDPNTPGILLRLPLKSPSHTAAE